MRFPRSIALFALCVSASSFAAVGVRHGTRTFGAGQDVPIAGDPAVALSSEIELSGATVSGAVRAEVPAPLTASVVRAGSGKATIRITVPAGAATGSRTLRVHSALTGIPPESVTLTVSRRPTIASFALNQPTGAGGRLVIEGTDLTTLVKSVEQAMLEVAGSRIQIDTGRPISATGSRLELPFACRSDGPFTVKKSMFSGRGLDQLSVPGAGGNAPDKAGTCSPPGPIERRKVD